MYDTKSTMALFCYLIEFVGQLREKYPALEVFFTKSKEVVLTQLLAI
ncbi:hypothetical protein J5893_05660 [bacterium]|nr:hypothetical protein [bacterium]